MEELFSRLQVGMSQQQAVALLLGCPDVDVCYSRGTTKGGKGFAQFGIRTLIELPPPDVLRCVVTVEDSEGWQVEVTLGPGGVVTCKRSTAPDLWTHLRRRWLWDSAALLGAGYSSDRVFLRRRQGKRS
jgi:hypothetical protein